ncbi:MAG: family 43 glycosylhydrolase [Clostridia bacterium]|nr:family 43 glycosylhydrolase [Clostridia bacterium]
MKTEDINIRDPFILPYDNNYYMYGTRVIGKEGFDVYKSADLKTWDKQDSIFEAYDGFWGTKDFWAPEVHLYNGKFYMFATFSSDTRSRGTQILVSDKPDGRFEVWSEVITPDSWSCLDGTLYIEDDIPYMVFCHEWTQIKDGEILAVELAKDLKKAVGEPFLLWKASEAKWVVGYDKPDSGDYITDGPFLFRDKNGRLCSLWSSFCQTGYAVAKAYSSNGKLNGKWINDDAPMFNKDGGHGMIFKTFEGKKLLSIHVGNNRSGKESPCFIELDI